jgi:hypothetical protein
MTRTSAGFELDIPLAYIESTIPAGVTIADYRRSRPARPNLPRRVVSRLMTRDNSNQN